jgi:hypothetical protein
MAKSRFRSQGNYHEELEKRTEEAISGNYTTIFKPDAKLPFWKDSEGDHALDIIPWISSENHPNYQANKPVYKVEVWVHKRVGPEKGDYICLRNYGEDCPLCEARNDEMAKESPRKKITDSLKGSQRCFYNVVVYTNNQEDKGVQIWEASSYLAESRFKETAKNKRTGVRIAYADPDKGKTITFTVEGKMTSKNIAGIVFEDRPSPIDDEILDEAFTIEDYLVKPNPEDLEKIAKIILGGALDPEDEEPEPPKRQRRVAEEEEDEAPPPKRRKPAPPIEEEDEDEVPPPRRRKPAPPVEEDAEYEEEAPPPPRRKKPAPVEEDDAEEEAPPPRRKKPAPVEEDDAEEEPPPTRRMRRRS